MLEDNEIAAAMYHLGKHAMNFSRIQRTGVCHADGTPETDGDHTVMLGWLAPALAQTIDVGLDPGFVAELALVHDAAEVYAGDTSTIDLTDEEFQAKYDREAVAAAKLVKEFGVRMSRFSWAVRTYEEQVIPEARFVRAVDKLMPKVVHLIDGLHGLHEAGTTRERFAAMAVRQREQMTEYASQWPKLFDLHRELCEQVLDMPQWDEPTANVVEEHLFIITNHRGSWRVAHRHCRHRESLITCPFTVAAQSFVKRNVDLIEHLGPGTYKTRLDEFGKLILSA